MSSLRNYFFWAVLSVAVLACQSTRPQTIQETLNLPKTVYRLAELDKNPAALDAVFQHIMRGQTVVLKIDKGYILPLIFDLKNKTAQIDLNNNTVELSFKQDMFLSISKATTKLSKDGYTWYDIKDLNALKRLLAFNRGALTFSVSANSGDSVALLMTIATDAETHR